MKIYHVSMHREFGNKTFTPCVPESCGPTEDQTIPRICFADSIEHCLTAIGEAKPNSDNIEYYITVYELDVEEDDINLVDWKTVYTKYGVRDAWYTKEYWYLGEITLSPKRYILRGFENDVFYLWSEEVRPQVVELLLSLVEDKETVGKEIENLLVPEIVHDYVCRRWDQLKIDEMDVFEHLGDGSIRAITDIKYLAEDVETNLFGTE